jgi:hypothetical protein
LKEAKTKEAEDGRKTKKKQKKMEEGSQRDKEA